MEALLGILVELLVELLLWAFLEFGVALGLTVATARPRAKREQPFRIVQIVAGIAITGFAVGVLSTMPFPGHLFESIGVRIVSFIASPIVSGGAMYLFGRWWWEPERRPPALWTFRGAVGFAFAVELGRFIVVG